MRDFNVLQRILFLTFFMSSMFDRQEALEAAISEKDAHLALLEVSGLRTARQAEEAEQLRADRTRLTERLKLEVGLYFQF